MISCQVCGKQFHNINLRHLSGHGLTREQYQASFPDAPIQSPESAAKRLAAAMSREAKMTDATRKAKGNKISAAKAGGTSWNAGKGGYTLEWSEEAKQRRKEIGAWNKNIPMSEEQKEKQSKTMLDNYATGKIVHWNTGNTVSAEVRAKISASCKNYELTPEQKEKHLNGIRLWVASDNYINAMKGKTHSAETKLKISKQDLLSADKKRKSMEEGGYWIPLAQLPEVQKYRREVWKLTNQNALLLPNYDATKRGRCSNTRDNWQIDHKLSIIQGWLDGITPEQMSHPVNLQFIPWRDNLAKWHRSSLKKEELLELLDK